MNHDDLTKEIKGIKDEIHDLKNQAIACHKKVSFLEEALREVYNHHAKQGLTKGKCKLS